MNWQLKAFSQRFLSNLPGGRALYTALQYHFGGLADFSVDSKVHQAMRLLSGLDQAGITLKSKKGVEIGTGWVPIVPLVFWLYSMCSCDSFDIECLFMRKLLDESILQVIENRDRFFNDSFQHNQVQFENIAKLVKSISLKSPSDYFPFIYHAPVKFEHSALPEKSIDIIFSNTTIEHIPPGGIWDILTESRRVIKGGGVMAHLIDCSDHFSHSDPSITPINFLQFENSKWQTYNSPFLYQNRLRPVSYRELFEKAGFRIILWQPKISQQLKSKLDTFPLATEFQDFSSDDICTTSILVVARCQ